MSTSTRAVVALQLALLGCGSSQKCPEPPAAAIAQQPGPAATTSTGAPAPSTPNQPPPGVFHIEVAKDGSLSIEGQAVPSLQDLADRARASAKSRPDLLVVVSADNDTTFSKVLAAFETAKRAGFQRVIIAEGRVPHTASAKPQQSVPQLVTGDSFKCEVHQHIEGLDKKSAFIAIHVGPDGVAQTVDLLEDPGSGLGDAARTCALAQSYRPALDASGKPTTGVKKLRIFFVETH